MADVDRTLDERGNAPPRDDGDWVRRLTFDGRAAEGARKDLRALLVVGLVRVLGKRGVAPDACEDFAQEALLKIEERLGSFRGESRFTTWALAIATRVAFDELRHRRWKDVSFEELTARSAEPLAFEPRADLSPEHALARERTLAALREAIEEELTPRQRAVLRAELEGMPQAEIALQLGMNRNALYKLAHDARKKVKSRLEAAGITEVDALASFA